MITNDNLTKYVEIGKKYIAEINSRGLNSTQSLSLFKIGKPCSFPSSIDQNHRIKDYIESKMNVIDLIPCSYKLPLTKVLEAKNRKDKNFIVDSIKPLINYEGAIADFIDLCGKYNLPNRHGGLRLYLTDDTTATDEFSNSYQDNYLGSKFNKFADAKNQFSSITRSVDDNFEGWARSVMKTIGQGATTLVDTFLPKSEEGKTGISDVVAGVTRAGVAAATIAATGNKLALPKVWSDSSYSPNFNAVIKLVSPYGHPDAIQEFIIKPLMYLLILSSARSHDQISYGQGPKLTVKAYGITHLPLASISGISLRKGGADTSFNIYRQPLSIDVSLTFQALIPGFAVETNPSDQSKFQDFSADKSMSLPKADQTFFSNMGTIIESIKPVAINTVAREYTKGNRLPNTELAFNESVFAIEGKALADARTAARTAESNHQIAALNSQNQSPTVPKSPTELLQATAETANKQAGESLKAQIAAKREGVGNLVTALNDKTKNFEIKKPAVLSS